MDDRALPDTIIGGCSPAPRDDPYRAMPVLHGHFRLESGLHAEQWIDLEAVMADPRALAPAIEDLCALLVPFRPTAICGPLIGGAFVAQAVATAMGLRFYYTRRLERPRDDALFTAVYALPASRLAAAADERFAIVDDIVSAGSSTRATCDAVTAAGASIAAIGALMILGNRAVDHFASKGTALVSRRFEAFESWPPAQCPSCRATIALSDPPS